MHPRIPEYQKQFADGKITRREFLRITTLLGLSATSAIAMAACAQPAPATAPAEAPAPDRCRGSHRGAGSDRSP